MQAKVPTVWGPGRALILWTVFAVLALLLVPVRSQGHVNATANFTILGDRANISAPLVTSIMSELLRNDLPLADFEPDPALVFHPNRSAAVRVVGNETEATSSNISAGSGQHAAMKVRYAGIPRACSCGSCLAVCRCGDADESSSCKQCCGVPDASLRYYKCSAGSASEDWSGRSPCYYCDPGTYQPYSGQYECWNCDSGTHQPNYGATRCYSCSPPPWPSYQVNRGTEHAPPQDTHTSTHSTPTAPVCACLCG